MAVAHQTEHEVRHPTTKQYVMIATILFAITIVEFVLIWDRAGIDDNLGASKVPLLIFLSAIKFAMVILLYMHLKFDNPFFLWVFLGGLALAFMVGLALLGLFTAIKGETRDYASDRAVPFEHEGEGGLVHADEGSGAGGETSTDGPTGGPVIEPSDISVPGDDLIFDTARMGGISGEELTVTLSNMSSGLQHNWVLVQNGTKDEVAADGLVSGAGNNYVLPGDTRVIAHTKLVDGGAEEEVIFTVPDPGTYQFVCTFPGHNLLMFGDFVATEAGTSDLPAASEEASDEQPVAPVSGGADLAISTEGDDLAFNASQLEAEAGAEVTLSFTNSSSGVPHNWVLVEGGTKDAVAADGVAAAGTNWVPPNDPRVIANTILVDAGSTESVTFTAPGAGTYQFVCTFPGHSVLMFGDFVVN